MHYVVTGAAGFIGSKLIEALNRQGIREIIAVDNLENAAKFRNLANLDIEDYLDKRDFLDRLLADQFDDTIEAVLHQGACSDTMESDGRYMMENNYRYSRLLLDWSQEAAVPFLYASSAAVYGAGPVFREERIAEQPLNVYGYSKFLFDQHVRARLASRQSQIAGFRYFNVYGPNEAHKGRMASVAFHAFNQFQAEGVVRLFKGSDGYEDGAQRRDFVHVDDVVSLNMWFLARPEVSGIYNCGTGRAQTFNDVAHSVINTVRGSRGEAGLTLEAMRSAGLIQYIDLPPALAGKYQSYTQADLGHLRKSGCGQPFMAVEEGVGSYVTGLLRGDRTVAGVSR